MGAHPFESAKAWMERFGVRTRLRRATTRIHRRTRSTDTARYLGNKNKTEVHDTNNEQTNCQLSEIKERKTFTPDTLTQAHKEGYDNTTRSVARSSVHGALSAAFDDFDAVEEHFQVSKSASSSSTCEVCASATIGIRNRARSRRL